MIYYWIFIFIRLIDIILPINAINIFYLNLVIPFKYSFFFLNFRHLRGVSTKLHYILKKIVIMLLKNTCIKI